jgi:hypothetical protein
VESRKSMNILRRLDVLLSNPHLRRSDTVGVEEAFDELTTEHPTLLKEFFLRFRGPLGSNSTGFQLLDIIEDESSITTATKAIRKRFNIGPEWLVISNLLANGAIFYNAKTDEVFDVDFEGGVELLKDGKLLPRWQSLEEFLKFFFRLDG